MSAVTTHPVSRASSHQPSHQPSRHETTLGATATEPVPMAPSAFSRRFAARLVSERRASRRPLWVVATRSRGDLTIRDLRDAESGLLPLDPPTVVRLAELYQIPVRELVVGAPRGITIADGVVSGGGISVPFDHGDPRSLVAAYFRLIRTLRAVEDTAADPPARADDLAVIAAHLEDTATSADHPG